MLVTSKVRVLVSGFGTFLEETVNPTEQIANFVNSCDSHNRSWSSLDVRGVVLPVNFATAFSELEKERLEFQPDIILSFGLAGGRTAIEIEQLAVNFRNAIDQLAPQALATTLPSEKLIAGMLEREIAARISMTAGTYVCNDLFFKMQQRLRFTRVRSGFIHVPRLAASSSTISETSWPWEKFESAVDSILTTLAQDYSGIAETENRNRN